MDKNKFAPVPPMGWNSYDYYDTTVTEAEVKANADYMAKYMKEFGYEYVVVDIEWYAHGAGTKRSEYQYIPFSKLEMDEYSRLLPDPERFPSSVNGAGFKPLADYVHSLGLKFGIHIMRGIPRIAAHMNMGLKGTNLLASDIADAYNICPWNPDMYGLDMTKKESFLYYDSLMELYAQWGVDFIKCDDIARFDAKSAGEEIVALRRAIDKCGRNIVLSLSPGPAFVEKNEFYCENANMWRITDDLWDNWPHILNMFERCSKWQGLGKEGCYPDCDMIPFGKIGKGFEAERDTNLTYPEQITLMSLWCIFGSPLMVGADLPQLDEKTLELLTNRAVIDLLSYTKNRKELYRDEKKVLWQSEDTRDGSIYVAVFNLEDEEKTIAIKTISDNHELLWNLGEKAEINGSELTITIAPHGAQIIRFI